MWTAQSACDRASTGPSASPEEQLIERGTFCKTHTAQWNEEAKLHDGTTVVVGRRARACAGGFPNSSRGRDLSFGFAFAPMNVEGTGPPDRDPVAFEIYDGVPS